MSSEATHWCYACRELIVLDWGDSLCPYCDGGFVAELDAENQVKHTYSSSSESGRNSNFDVRARSGSEQSWGLTFHGEVPEFTLATGNPRRRVDFGDSPSITPGLQELIQQLIYVVNLIISLFLIIIKFIMRS